MKYRFEMKLAALVVCAAVAAACEAGMQSPSSPSAAVGAFGGLNADGSNLKAGCAAGDHAAVRVDQYQPESHPGRACKLRQIHLERRTASLSHRFQVSDAEAFSNIVASGTGSTDASGVTRWTVDPALTANKRYVWRVRAEMGDAFGPWSKVMAFTTATGTASGGGGSTAPPTTSTGPRTPDPAPGVRLPLPDIMASWRGSRTRAIRARAASSDVNNPWQDRVIDAFRQIDTRWGYNGKPTRTAADNNGVPVVAAGDEAAYHYSGGPDQGSPTCT